MKEIEYNFNVTVSEELLTQRNMTIENIKDEMLFLIGIFGDKHKELLPENITDFDVERVLFLAKTLRSIQKCDGFQRHIQQYNPKEWTHFFTAKVASYLCGLGYKVTLEPDMGRDDGPHPDLKIEKSGDTCYVECKTSDISRFYKKAVKEEVSNIVYEQIQTPDQVDLFFSSEIDIAELRRVIKDQQLNSKIQKLYDPTVPKKETRLNVTDDLEIGVIQRDTPPTFFSGKKGDYVSILVQVLDNKTKTKMVGYIFEKPGGRPVGVHELVSDYHLKWKDKKEKSEKQMIDGYPNIVFVDEADVLGDPAVHQDYFDEHWLTPERPTCTGVAILGTTKNLVSDEYENSFTFYENTHATEKFTIE